MLKVGATKSRPRSQAKRDQGLKCVPYPEREQREGSSTSTFLHSNIDLRGNRWAEAVELGSRLVRHLPV